MLATASRTRSSGTNGTTVNNTVPAFVVAAMLMSGCHQQQQSVANPNEMVYVDIATQTPMTLPVQASIPAAHPKTGKKTLVPGLYCPECGVWYPAPPVEVLQRTASAFHCPKGGHPMSPNGPRPPVE